MDLQSFAQLDLNLKILNHLFNQMETDVNVTFWGSRIVTTGEFRGSAYLADFAEQVLWFSRLPDKSELSLEERVAGIQLVDTIRKSYRESDKILDKYPVKKAFNIFWQITGYDRDEKVVLPLSTRLFIEDEITRKSFLSFTEKQFHKDFGDLPLPFGSFIDEKSGKRLYVADEGLIKKKSELKTSLEDFYTVLT